MKAPAKKPKTAAKAAVKPVAKPAVKAKAALKTAAKASKPVVKAKAVAAKPVAKSKPGVKVVAKAVTKVSAKTAPNAAKAAKTPASKVVVKSVAAKAKFSSKVSAPPAKALAKTDARKMIKTPAKSASKAVVASSKPVKAEKTPAPTKLVKPAKAAAVPAAGKKTIPPVTAAAPLTEPRSAESKMPNTATPALKPGRKSSARALAHMPPPAPMVPTHAPDAAKASYSAMTDRFIPQPPHVAAKKDPKLANNWKTKSAEELTDEEVKSMPDTEYMNDKQLAFFRHKLSILKQEIHNSAGETTEHLREDTVVVPDPADRATIEEEHALELRTRDRERKLLKKIEQSIARIDSGDYGYCDETGEAIGVGRLIARPTANLSLEAQQRRELKQKMFGD